MTDSFELEKVEMPDPGTYPVTCTGVTLDEVDFQQGRGVEKVLRFDFAVEHPKGTLQLDGVANVHDASGNLAYGNGRYKLTKWVLALCGELPDTLSPDALVGRECLGVLDLDSKGFIRLMSLIAPVKGSSA